MEKIKKIIAGWKQLKKLQLDGKKLKKCPPS
jgi:hypothetical protein